MSRPLLIDKRIARCEYRKMLAGLPNKYVNIWGCWRRPTLHTTPIPRFLARRREVKNYLDVYIFPQYRQPVGAVLCNTPI